MSKIIRLSFQIRYEIIFWDASVLVLLISIKSAPLVYYKLVEQSFESPKRIIQKLSLL